MFVAREHELGILEDGYTSDRSEFCILYGRRRIGKSTLLERFVEGKPAFFYLAGKEAKRLQLKRFVRELGEAVGDPLTGKVAVATWDEALTLLDRCVPSFCQKAGARKVIIVLDEFQWMCQSSPELLSDLQRFWDKHWSRSGQVYCILCGSSTSFMLGEVLAEKSPLFGRRTQSFHLGPLSAREVGLFFPEKGRFEVTQIYLTVGGIPKYLEIMQSRLSFQKLLSREAFTSSGFFFDEVRFVLSEQLKETATYFLVLKALARRPMGVSELEKATSVPGGHLMYCLERLQLLGFVSRHLPFEAKPTAKRVRYRLDDYFLRFHFSFIAPFRERISLAENGVSFADITAGRWNQYAGLSFEQFVRDHAWIIAGKMGLRNAISSVGSYWQRTTKQKKGVQIDLLIGCEDSTTLVCECKWSRRRVGLSAVEELRGKASLFPNESHSTLRLVLIAAGGVTAAVRRQKDVTVIEMDDFWV